MENKEMTLGELISKLNEFVAKGYNPNNPVMIGHYTEDGTFYGDLALVGLDWLFLSSEDNNKPNYDREKVVELKCFDL